MKRTIYKCPRCNEAMDEYSVSFQSAVAPVGYVCMKDGCDRRGLISATAKVAEIEE